MESTRPSLETRYADFPERTAAAGRYVVIRMARVWGNVRSTLAVRT